MGRWTPLILMAGGLAILLGTLLGINFPMDGQNAQAPTRKKESQVLPANINVNSTRTGSSGQNGNQNNVAQNNNNTSPNTLRSAPTTTAQGNTSTTDSTTPSSSTAQQGNQSGSNAPIRALW